MLHSFHQSRTKRSMDKRLQLTFSICVFSLILIASASFPARDSWGIAPQDESYYKASVIKCKDGSKKFSRDKLNDEFCDCPDGTDEPGTSACPEGKFYCRNSGHSPTIIFSSRVNDGICDCCDGSDEYDGKVNCSNTCWEAGKAARKKLSKKIETFKEGVIIRNKEVENAKVAFAKDEAELAKLKGEEKMLKNLVDQLKEQKERIEKAEAEEKEKKEAEEKRLKEEAEKLNPKKEVLESSNEKEENDDENNKMFSRESPAQKFAKENDVHHDKDEIVSDQHESGDSLSKEPDLEQKEGLSKEELGRLVASRWTGEKSNENDENTPKTEIDENTPTNDENTPTNDENAPTTEDDFFKDHDEKDEGYNSELEDDRHKYKYEDSDNNNNKYEDEYESDEEYEDNDNNNYNNNNDNNNDDHDDGHHSDNSGSWLWLDKIQQTVQNVFQSFNFFKTPVDLSDASRVKKEYDDLSSKLTKIQSRISNLNDKLKHDFGKDKEFYSFYDKCFENKQNKYVYKVCPYKKASQNEGHSSTQLGRWEKFEDSYRVMIFSNGDHCWNGPNRSLKVRLRCGLNNEVADVDEPSRCEYIAILSTPAMCVEEKLKELEQKLEDLNSSHPSIHDEL